jgi:hypothetical protein
MTDIIEARPQQRVAIPRDCSFHPTDWDVLSKSWFPVARADEVEDRPTKARLLDVDLVVYRTGDVARVARDLCFHRGAALSMGWVEGDLIVCPYHGTYPEKRSRNKWLGRPLLDGDNIDDNSAGKRKSEIPI